MEGVELHSYLVLGVGVKWGAPQFSPASKPLIVDEARWEEVSLWSVEAL